MRVLLYICIFIFTIGSISSQTYINERYNYIGNTSFDFAYDILYDSGIVIPGGGGESDNYFIGIKKLDDYGLELTTAIVQDEFYGFNFSTQSRSMQRFSSSSFFGVGLRREYASWIKDYAILYKFDNNFDTLWTRVYGETAMPDDTNYSFNQWDYTNDNGIIVVGGMVREGEEGHTLLMKIDSLGNEQWRRFYQGGGPLSLGTNVISLPDGGYAVSSYFWQFQSTISGSYLIRTDSLGNELWRKFIDGPLDDGSLKIVWSAIDSTIVGAYHYGDSAVTNGTSFNRLTLIKVNLNGEEVYHRKYLEKNSFDQWNFYVNSISINSNNRLIVVGQTYQPWPQAAGYLFKFSNNGDSLWYRQYQKLYGQDTYNYLTAVTPTPDGGYAASGYVVPYPPDTGNQDVWVIKVDSMGCISEDDCWVGQKERIALQKQGVLKIYPNPATTGISIVVPKENESEKHLLTIWDIFGRRAKEMEVPGGITKIALKLSGFSPGLYTAVSVHNGRVLFRGKFVKQ